MIERPSRIDNPGGKQLELVLLELHRLEVKIDEIARSIWKVKAKASLYAGVGAALGTLGPRLPNWLQESSKVFLGFLF